MLCTALALPGRSHAGTRAAIDVPILRRNGMGRANKR